MSNRGLPCPPLPQERLPIMNNNTPPPATLAWVASLIEADPTLSPTQRQDMVSALHTLARVIGRDIGTIAAEPKSLAVMLRSVSPQQAGISEKRLANVKSAVSTALRLTNTSDLKPVRRIPITSVWQPLLDSIPIEHDRIKVLRFARWCGAMGLAPADVSNDSVVAYHQQFIETSLSKEPARAVVNLVRVWNRLSRDLPEWPRSNSTSPGTESV